MELEPLAYDFTVCKVRDLTEVDRNAEFCFTARTDTEVSVVCPTDRAPVRTTAREDGWRGLRVRGTLEFSLVGILAELTAVLAGRGIPVFAVSTFDTDYLLVRRPHWEAALDALRAAGHTVG